jgi:CRP/FNR family transcriptional regulator
LHLSRQEIADLTAMSKDSAIRILKDFERDGIISMQGNQMSILDKDQLKDISLKG